MEQKPRKVVGARELKTRLGTYIRQVSEGLVIVVTERGRPVAELRPLEPGGGVEGRLKELMALGAVTRSSQRSLDPFSPVLLKGAPMSETVQEQREDRF